MLHVILDVIILRSWRLTGEGRLWGWTRRGAAVTGRGTASLGCRKLLVAALLLGLVLSMAPVAAGGQTDVAPTAGANPSNGPLAAPSTQPRGLATDGSVGGSGVVSSSLSGVVAQGGGSGAGSLCNTSGVGQFSDVAPGDYGDAYILCMRELGLSVGIGSGEFGPDQTLTRGQMASFLVRLWRDVLDRGCPRGRTPFMDVAGNVHEENIACIYNLGITVGTTATTYSPHDDLTASQISRFLLRTYEKAGNNCPNRGSELNEAVDCLFALRVISHTEQGKSSLPVTRSQMAVYVIGLWHNLSGRGLPPIPPGPGRDRLKPIPDELTTQANVVTTGRMELPVYICAQANKYTIAHLRSATDKLNQKVAPFFRNQSSGQADVHFVTGGVVSPHLDWDGITLETLWGFPGDDPCSDAATGQEGHRQTVILVDVRPAPNVAGFAAVSFGPAVQSMAHHFWSDNVYFDLVAHEVGHARFGYFHTHELESYYTPLSQFHNERVYDPDDDSLMSYNGTRDIDTTHIACAQRVQARWPTGPPLPNGRICTGSDSGPGQGDPVPNPPENLSVTPGDGQLIVQWEPPFSAEGWQWLTSYTVSFENSRGEIGERTVSDTRVIIAGLTNSVTYTIKVTADNSTGASQPAIATATPIGPTATVPGVPTNVRVTPGDSELTVTWSPPSDDGGSPITAYVVTYRNGRSDTSITVGSGTRSYRIGSLTNDVPITVRVHARNRHGDGPSSTPITATPVAAATVPGVPTNVRVTPGDSELTVTWSSPSDDGGSPITAYVVTYRNGRSDTSITVGSGTRSYRIGSLTNDVPITVRVHARKPSW